MDLITQGLLGGTLALAVARRDDIRLAGLAGMVSGVLADADVLIRSGNDPLLGLEFHRHFTHSLFFVPFGALLAAMLLWPFMRSRLPFARLYLFTLMGFSLSGFIDACTSYGTLWLWPLSDERLAFGIISIIDPVFTLILLVALWLGLRRRARRPALIGLLLCGGYLLLGWGQSQRVEQQALQLAKQRGHAIEQLMVKPTLANLLLWRSIYVANETIYIDAIRAGLGAARVYPGAQVSRFDRQRDLPELAPDTVLARDIDRFVRWSAGYVHFDRQRGLLGDMRYSMLPTSAAPLWGLQIETDSPQQHARYRLFRDMGVAERRRFVDLLLGLDLAADEKP